MSLHKYQKLFTLLVLILFGLSDSSASGAQASPDLPASLTADNPAAPGQQSNTLFLPAITNWPAIHIPTQSEWVDKGTILEAGKKGEWDYYLWGGFAFSVIKRDGIYYMYYQGASDYSAGQDETVFWRAIGAATSSDGIHFTKYPGNPILTWFPNQVGEEGATSSGVTLGENGETILYYGANTAESDTTVSADTRVATSVNGLNVQDQGVVLDNQNPSVWGSGDELFAVDAIFEQGQWIVYYIPNGTPESGWLGVAYGSQYNQLKQTSPVTSNGKKVAVWGTAGHVKLNPFSYALVLNNIRTRRTEVRLMSPQSPAVVSAPVAVYQFPEVQQAFLLLDHEKGTWFLYYRTYDNRYGVKTAPVIKK